MNKNKKIKILIGTPVHISKDYTIEKWIQNVFKLQNKSPTDVLLVDNSPNKDFMEKVKGYCIKYNLKNYTIKHLEIDEKLGIDLRIEASQEIIRQYVLSHDYDGWFSWECDQIVPSDTLNKLVKLLEAGNFMMVIHNSWARWDPTIPNTNMGVTLIKRECLKKGWFLPKREGKISLSLSDSYDVNETMFKKRVLRRGGNYVEVYGVIKPIYHLNK